MAAGPAVLTRGALLQLSPPCLFTGGRRGWCTPSLLSSRAEGSQRVPMPATEGCFCACAGRSRQPPCAPVSTGAAGPRTSPGARCHADFSLWNRGHTDETPLPLPPPHIAFRHQSLAVTHVSWLLLFLLFGSVLFLRHPQTPSRELGNTAVVSF